MALLEAEGLSKIYGNRKVVDGVSLSIDQGEIVGLLGRNGAGKTTSFKMIIGLVTPNSGHIAFRGTDVTYWPVYKRARLGMGFLSQEPSVFQRLTVLENLLAILEIVEKNGSNRGSRALALLEEFGLAQLSDQKAYTLSGGEKRRLEICRALLTRPRIVLLDEPFAGVDPKAVSELQGFIKNLRSKGIGVLLTDHNVRETLQVTNRSYIIDEGKVLAHGPPADIVNNPVVREKYLGEHFRM